MGNLSEDIDRVRLLQELSPQILEVVHDALVVVDAEGLIVLVNKRTELLFGYHRTELIDQPVETLIPETLREQHTQHRAMFGDNPYPRLMGVGKQLYGRKKNGQQFPAEISLSPLPTPRGLFVVTLVRAQLHAP
jgi:PAS domain S-box-containing protein